VLPASVSAVVICDRRMALGCPLLMVPLCWSVSGHFQRPRSPILRTIAFMHGPVARRGGRRIKWSFRPALETRDDVLAQTERVRKVRLFRYCRVQSNHLFLTSASSLNARGRSYTFSFRMPPAEAHKN